MQHHQYLQIDFYMLSLIQREPNMIKGFKKNLTFLWQQLFLKDSIMNISLSTDAFLSKVESHGVSSTYQGMTKA